MVPKEYLTDEASALLNEDMLTVRSFLGLKNAIETYFERCLMQVGPDFTIKGESLEIDCRRDVIPDPNKENPPILEYWVMLKHDTHTFKIQSFISSHPLDAIIDTNAFNEFVDSYSEENWAIRYSLKVLYSVLYRYFETTEFRKVSDEDE
jgi:hypothetical protein